MGISGIILPHEPPIAKFKANDIETAVRLLKERLDHYTDVQLIKPAKTTPSS